MGEKLMQKIAVIVVISLGFSLSGCSYKHGLSDTADAYKNKEWSSRDFESLSKKCKKQSGLFKNQHTSQLSCMHL